MTARRVVRAARLTAELGHADILDALLHAEEMRSALRVIYTWTGVDGEYLDHRQVRKLAAKALHMGANDKAQGEAQGSSRLSPGATGSAAQEEA
jgi:predicted kinase